MKFTIPIFTLLLFFTNTSSMFAQTSPILWINSAYNIHIDTISNKRIEQFPDIMNTKAGRLQYTFKNIGKYATFVDTVFRGYNQFVTKPQETSTVSLYLSYALFNFHHAFWRRKDTTAVLTLPFYYEGKIYQEKVSCTVSFGKSKLIEYDNFYIDATEKVTQLVNATTNKYSKITFTHYFTIKNISNEAIFCTKKLVTDSNYFSTSLKNENDYAKVLPGETYQIPVQLSMFGRYKFCRKGKVEVLGAGIGEIYKCEIVSKFEEKDK